MFKPLNPQMRVSFNTASIVAALGITWGLYSQGYIGGDFSSPAPVFCIHSVAGAVVALRLFIQQAETPEELQRLFFRRPRG